MEQSTAQRRLVKSPPELWAQVSDEDALGRRLAAFGEIRITRVDPETTVAWEGDRASGTVELAAVGWGTKVILTATPAAAAEHATPPPAQRKALPAAPTAPPAIPREPAPPVARGLLGRLLRRRQTSSSPPAPQPGPAPARIDPDPAPNRAVQARPLDPDRTVEILSGVLDDLGSDHRPVLARD